MVVEQRRVGAVAVDPLSHQHRRRPRLECWCRGLLRRMENLVRNTEDYREQVQSRYEHAVRRTDELAAVADAPFEHSGDWPTNRPSWSS